MNVKLQGIEISFCCKEGIPQLFPFLCLCLTEAHMKLGVGRQSTQYLKAVWQSLPRHWNGVFGAVMLFFSYVFSFNNTGLHFLEHSKGQNIPSSPCNI